jgi:hypothetical protein
MLGTDIQLYLEPSTDQPTVLQHNIHMLSV